MGTSRRTPHPCSIARPYPSALQRILSPAGITPKSGNTPILKCPTDFPLILWHPYARHYYFCLMTGKEQEKWGAVFQDCVRHCNNGERGGGTSVGRASWPSGSPTAVSVDLQGKIQG